MNNYREAPTIVLVHGAWADGSSWKDVIQGLEREGIRLVAAPIPLTSLGDDAGAVKRVVARTEGPVILSGHAYAGAVIGMDHDEARRGDPIFSRSYLKAAIEI